MCALLRAPISSSRLVLVSLSTKRWCVFFFLLLVVDTPPTGYYKCG